MNSNDDRDPDRPPREEEGIRDRIKDYVPDIVKRTVLGGLGAVFATEEGIRRFVQESHLPKEVATYLLDQAQATKNELYRIIAGELREWLERVDLERVLLRLLTSLTFEITTQVRLVPNEGGLVKPEIKPRVKVRRRRDASEEFEDTEIPLSISVSSQTATKLDGEEPPPAVRSRSRFSRYAPETEAAGPETGREPPGGGTGTKR
jgi:hypothetical protein